MRILVIGGTRFIGLFAVRELVALGHDIAVLHRGESERDLPRQVRHVHTERTRTDAVRDAAESFRPDVVLDTAAMCEQHATSLLDAIGGVTQRVVVVSSMDVYRAYGRMHGSESGPVEPMPLTEDSPLRERLYPYRGERDTGDLDDYDKIPVERFVMSDARVAGSVIRLPAVHGEHDYQRRTFMEVRRFEARRPYVLMAEEARSWRWARGYVENVAHAIALVTTQGAAQRVYHVADDASPTQEEYVQSLAEISGWRGEIIFAPNQDLPEHLRSNVNFAQDMVADTSRIRRELGYRDVVEPHEGLRRAVEWEHEHPPKKMPQQLLNFEAEDAFVARLRS